VGDIGPQLCSSHIYNDPSWKVAWWDLVWRRLSRVGGGYAVDRRPAPLHRRRRAYAAPLAAAARFARASSRERSTLRVPLAWPTDAFFWSWLQPS
jgi:hypothetical protein